MLDHIDDDISRRLMGTTAHIAPCSPGTSCAETKPYRTGNKCPPIEHQFQKGKSGNPKGRPKGSLNIWAALVKALQRRVRVGRGGDSSDEMSFQVMIDQAVSASMQKEWRPWENIMNLLREGIAAGKISLETGLPATAATPKDFSWTASQERLYRKLEELERQQADQKKPDGA